MSLKKDFFRNLGETVVAHRNIVLSIWIVLFILGIAGALNVDKVLHGEGSYVKNSESFLQNEMLKTDFPRQFPANIIVTLESSSLTVDEPGFEEAVVKIRDYLTSRPEVGDIYDLNTDSSLLSKDRKSTFIVAGLKETGKDMTGEVSHEIADDLKQMPLDAGLERHITGSAIIVGDMSEMSEKDSATAERRILPVVIVLLIIVFGALVSAILPVLIGFMSIAMTLGCLFVIGHYFELTIFCKAITSMMGFGVGIDYSLFMVSRFKEELKKGVDFKEAAIITTATAGKAVCYSGFAVSVGMAALLVPDLPLTRSIGFSGVLVVTIAILLSLTLLPVIFSILGDRINSPRKLNRLVELSSRPKNFWFNWSQTVMKRPWAFLICGLTGLFIVSMFTFSMKLWNSSVLLMPEELDSRKGFETMLEIDPSRKFSPIGFTFETKDGTNIYERKNLEEIYNFAGKISSHEKIDRILGLVNPASEASLDEYINLYSNALMMEKLGMVQPNPFVSSDATKAVMWAMHKDDINGTADWETVVELRKLRDSYNSNNLNILVGGGGSTNVDFQKAVYEYFPVIIVLILAATYIIMFSLLGSVLLPLKAIVMNILSVTASYGFLVLVFQYGFLSNFMGISTIPGAILIITPLVLFCIIFGLSMDYEIFMMSRIKEEYDKSNDTTYAVAMGLEKSGGIITSAALIMIIVFMAFAFSEIILVKEIGLGLTTAVFLDATIIRIMIVPSIMRILGKWAWWLPEGWREKLTLVKLEH